MHLWPSSPAPGRHLYTSLPYTILKEGTAGLAIVEKAIFEGLGHFPLIALSLSIKCGRKT